MAKAQPQQPNRWISVANGFGTLGYMSVFVQWAWAIVTVGYQFLASDMTVLFPEEATRVTPDQVPDVSMPPVMSTIIAVAVTVIMLIIVGIFLSRLPRSVGKSGATITHSTAKVIVPTLTHHKKIPQAKQRRLTFTVVSILKAVACIVPFVLVLFAPAIPELGTDLATIIAAFCLAMSACYFVTQLILTLALKLPREAIW